MSRLDFFPDRDLIQHYRAAFSTPAGKEVLTHLLFDLGAFEEVTAGPEDVALKNFGQRLMKILGGGQISGDTLQEFTRRLMLQPLPKQGEEQ